MLEETNLVEKIFLQVDMAINIGEKIVRSCRLHLTMKLEFLRFMGVELAPRLCGGGLVFQMDILR